MLKSFLKNIPFGLSLFLIVLAACLAAIIAPIGGNKALIVRSGSMVPAIGVGDLITVKPQQTYKVGEIIAFRDSSKAGTTVTHRIAAIEIKDGEVFYQTKGDANEEADFNPVKKENVIGRADFGIAQIGKLFAAVKTKNGFLATAVIPAALVIFFELANIIKEMRKHKNPASVQNRIVNQVRYDMRTLEKDVKADIKRIKIVYEHYGKPMGLPYSSSSLRSLFGLAKRNSRVIPIKLTAVLPILVGLLFVGGTFAFSQDTETSTGNTLSAASSFPSPSPTQPPPQTAPANVVINEFIANPQTTFTTEWVEIYNAGGSSQDLTGWSISDATATNHSLTALGTIGPGEFKVLDIAEGFLNNTGGDTVELLDGSSAVISTHTYATDTVDDQSIGRDTDGTGTFQDCASPTKGTTNNASC